MNAKIKTTPNYRTCVWFYDWESSLYSGALFRTRRAASTLDTNLSRLAGLQLQFNPPPLLLPTRRKMQLQRTPSPSSGWWWWCVFGERKIKDRVGAHLQRRRKGGAHLGHRWEPTNLLSIIPHPKDFRLFIAPLFYIRRLTLTLDLGGESSAYRVVFLQLSR